MKKTLYILLFLLASLATMPVKAQLDPKRLVPVPEKIGASIFDVQPDRMGNIWLASQSGLLRYDGYELNRYYPDPNDSTTTGEMLTYGLFQDGEGTIWIGCMGYITAYHPQSKSFTNYSLQGLTDFPLYAQAFVYNFAEDNRGKIYFGVSSFLNITAGHALLYFDKEDSTMKRYEYPEGDSILNIHGLSNDIHGNIWINAFNGLFMLDTLQDLHRFRFPVSGSGDTGTIISTIHCHPGGEVLLAANHFRLFAYDPAEDAYLSWKIPGFQESPNKQFYAYNMLTDSLGNTWIGSNYGLFAFNRAKESFSSFNDREILADDVYGMQFDAFGDLWIPTGSGNMFRYTNKTIFNSFASNPDEDKSITGGWATKIFPLDDGKAWIYTDGELLYAGLNLLDPRTNSIMPFPFRDLLPGMVFYNVVDMVRPGEFLIQTNMGYFECHPVTGKHMKLDLEASPWNEHIFTVYRDSRGNTCIGTTGGLYMTDPDGNTRHYDLETLPGSNAVSNEVTRILESKRGGLWLGTNFGFFRYHYGTDKIERIGGDPAKGGVLLSQDINSVHEDGEGKVWIGTWQGGLSKYDPGTGQFTTYTLNDGLPSMAIQGIIGDEDRNVLWLSTFDGISRFNVGEETFNNFSLEDGMQGTLYADGACAVTTDTTFIFGTNNGITYFRADDVAKKSLPPLVFINDFKVADKSYAALISTPYERLPAAKSGMVFSHDQNNIFIDYTGIHYANSSKIHFAYKLENWDDDWRAVKNVRTAYYYNLSPGDYTFRIKAANSNGVWNEKGASLSFTISPPWWRTWLAYVFYGLILLALIVAFDRLMRRRVLEKERRIAREKELAHAKEIEKAYKELKATQNQLIHSEKMASLGELTAGIAHEIQNPLNFVNNFSEVNLELAGELREEMKQGNLQEADTIAQDILLNEEKINFHGRRADAIVKSMLQHSRSSNGEKVPTDINALADEYLRLSYHGLRAKDKSFNADFKLAAEDGLPKINVVPQDIGRVLLNLINNAFYAVSERAKKNIPGYKPTVIVTIHRQPTTDPPQAEQSKIQQGGIEIRVKDNGEGIPKYLIEKIFQPFFTTKPTGEGTGLGLSMSYDIITKGHGGELKVETTEGEGTTFTILLSVN